MWPERTVDNRLLAWTLGADGAFELALGLALATAPLTGLASGLALPAPAAPALVAGVGALLVPVGLGLLALTRRPSARLVASVAALNAAGALLLVGWLAAGWTAFGAAGRLLVAATVAALAVLAALELAGLRRSGPPAVP